MLELENSIFKIFLKSDFPDFFAFQVGYGIEKMNELEEELHRNWQESLDRELSLDEKNYISATIQMFSGEYTMLQLFTVLEVAKIMIYMQDKRPEDMKGL